MMEGGDSGDAVLTGKSGDSLLIHLVAGLDPDNVMPQKGSRLKPAQIGVLRAWIDQGAPWPADDQLREDPAAQSAPDDGRAAAAAGRRADGEPREDDEWRGIRHRVVHASDRSPARAVFRGAQGDAGRARRAIGGSSGGCIST